MLTFTQNSFTHRIEPFRWTARASAVVLFALWLAYFIFDVARTPISDFGVETYAQACALAIVFAGYVIGWRRELAGGLIALAGTLAFFYAVNAGLHVAPKPEAVLFAVPGLLYLLSWCYEMPNQTD